MLVLGLVGRSMPPRLKPRVLIELLVTGELGPQENSVRGDLGPLVFQPSISTHRLGVGASISGLLES